MNRSEDQSARPLTPVTFHVLLSVAQGPAHGYRIKRVVEERTDGAVQLGAGTLYTGIRRMVRDGLIEETEAPEDAGTVEPSSRWRFYEITEVGSNVLKREIARLEADLQAAHAVVSRPG